MSTIKVNKIENTSTTAGGVEIDSSGHVQVDGVQMPTAGPLSNRNLIINGAMNVAQRGTSSTSSGLNTIDRFAAQWDQGAVTQSQEDLTTGSPFDSGFSHFFRLQNTTACTNAAGYREIVYKIEGQDIGNSGWTYKSSSSYITLSFWARASVAQDYYAFVESRVGGNRIYTFPFTLAADTWTYVTETIPGDSLMQVGAGNGLGFLVDFTTFYGTNYTGSSNTDRTWRNRNSAGDYMLDMTNTWANTTNATFDITGVQLEVGEKATPFEHRSYTDELQRCLRYFVRIDGGADAFTYSGKGQGTSSVDATIPLCVPLRASPTMNSINSRSFGDQSTLYSSSSTTPTALQFNSVNPHLAINCGGFSGLTNNEVSVWGPYASNLEISAEL